ncbi:MAG: hypothetical protein BWY74_03825 [Firmicutes bacterium ADurb.Bin419]|nr:MAG: hypothetical protein BWY74_03825 [Firmicutes bacterium ADurb.Bin419]
MTYLPILDHMDKEKRKFYDLSEHYNNGGSGYKIFGERFDNPDMVEAFNYWNRIHDYRTGELMDKPSPQFPFSSKDKDVWEIYKWAFENGSQNLGSGVWSCIGGDSFCSSCSDTKFSISAPSEVFNLACILYVSSICVVQLGGKDIIIANNRYDIVWCYSDGTLIKKVTINLQKDLGTYAFHTHVIVSNQRCYFCQTYRRVSGILNTWFVVTEFDFNGNQTNQYIKDTGFSEFSNVQGMQFKPLKDGFCGVWKYSSGLYFFSKKGLKKNRAIITSLRPTWQDMLIWQDTVYLPHTNGIKSFDIEGNPKHTYTASGPDHLTPIAHPRIHDKYIYFAHNKTSAPGSVVKLLNNDLTETNEATSDEQIDYTDFIFRGYGKPFVAMKTTRRAFGTEVETLSVDKANKMESQWQYIRPGICNKQKHMLLYDANKIYHYNASGTKVGEVSLPGVYEMAAGKEGVYALSARVYKLF